MQFYYWLVSYYIYTCINVTCAGTRLYRYTSDFWHGLIQLSFIPVCSPFSQIVPRVCTLVLFINPRRACARVTVLVLSVCLCVCVCVCVCVFPILAPRAIRRTNSSISDFSAIRAWNIKRDFSLKRFVPKLWRRLLTSNSSGVVSGILVPFFRRN